MPVLMAAEQSECQPCVRQCASSGYKPGILSTITDKGVPHGCPGWSGSTPLSLYSQAWASSEQTKGKGLCHGKTQLGRVFLNLTCSQWPTASTVIPHSHIYECVDIVEAEKCEQQERSVAEIKTHCIDLNSCTASTHHQVHVLPLH